MGLPRAAVLHVIPMDKPHPGDVDTAQQGVLLRNILDLRSRGEQTLLLSGAVPDEALVAELLTPGSDQRGGVSIIARPPAAVIYHIALLQRHLRTYELRQYYYPAGDLHLTVLEICSARPLSEVSSIAAGVVKTLPLAIRDVSVAHLGTPVLGYDARACALNFIPADQTLARMREQLAEQLVVHGVNLAPRYPAHSAHVTFMRYVESLRTPRERWVGVLKDLVSDASLRWTLSELWVTWGATWYGKQSRIHEAGPYRIEPLRSE